MNTDPWSVLRRHTSARIALGRAGASTPTRELLSFAADHADARDAVHSALEVEKLVEDLKALSLPVLILRSRAPNREVFLKCPDQGRRLDGASAAMVAANNAEEVDIALMVGDGLSAVAAQRHAAAVLGYLLPILNGKGFSVGPLCVVTQARVAVEDEVGMLLKARIAVILLGERPGLGTADSLGAYLVFKPMIGKNDAERNCVSNIRPGSLEPPAAAEAIGWLVEQSLIRGISGVNLKDERGPAAIGNTTASLPSAPRTIAIHRDRVFTFRFVDDRKIPRFHLDDVGQGRKISVIRIDPGTGERLAKIGETVVGKGGWVDLDEPIVMRAGEGFIAVVEPHQAGS